MLKLCSTTLRGSVLAASCVLGAATGCSVGSSPSESLVETNLVARTYVNDNNGWVACGAGRSDGDRERFGGSSRGARFSCSDGTHLTRITYECGSHPGAIRELQARVYGLGAEPPIWAPIQAVEYRDGLLVQLGNPGNVDFYVHPDGNAWVFARVERANVVTIYGPSREHIDEIIVADPWQLRETPYR